MHSPQIRRRIAVFRAPGHWCVGAGPTRNKGHNEIQLQCVIASGKHGRPQVSGNPSGMTADPLDFGRTEFRRASVALVENVQNVANLSLTEIDSDANCGLTWQTSAGLRDRRCDHEEGRSMHAQTAYYTRTCSCLACKGDLRPAVLLGRGQLSGLVTRTRAPLRIRH